MNFLESPHSFTRTARSSRDVCRDCTAIELPEPPDRTGHRWIVPACVVALMVVVVLIFMERV